MFLVQANAALQEYELQAATKANLATSTTVHTYIEPTAYKLAQTDSRPASTPTVCDVAKEYDVNPDAAAAADAEEELTQLPIVFEEVVPSPPPQPRMPAVVLPFGERSLNTSAPEPTKRSSSLLPSSTPVTFNRKASLAPCSPARGDCSATKSILTSVASPIRTADDAVTFKKQTVAKKNTSLLR